MLHTMKAALLAAALCTGAVTANAEVYSWTASSETPLYKTNGETLSFNGKSWTLDYELAKGDFSCDFYANYGLWFTYGFNDAGFKSLKLTCGDFSDNISTARIIMSNDKCTDSNFNSGWSKASLIVGQDTILPKSVTPVGAQGWAAEYTYDVKSSGKVCIAFDAECAAFILQEIEIETTTAAVKTEAPVISPDVAEITTLTPVTITSPEADAVIYYTVDGRTPTTASTIYSGPFFAPAGYDIAIKAIAQAPGKGSSQVVSQTYASVVADTQADVTTWSYKVDSNSPALSADNLTVTLNSKKWTATYTGACSMILNYAGYGYFFGNYDLNSLTFSSADFKGMVTEVRVNAMDLDYSDWAGTNASFTVTVGGKEYNCISKKVSASQGAIADYVFTTDTPASGTISLNFHSTNGQFIIGGIEVDEMIERTATPVVSPDADEMTNETAIIITCADADARIYYTLDGSLPTSRATEYTAPIIVEPGDVMLRVMAVAPGKRQSQEVVKMYTVKDANEDNPTGIDHIAADGDDTAAEYFTISGMRVSASALRPGIYIKRQGAKTSKIIIR